jgi:uncharacterized protein YbaA (DUF1428 family)
MFVQLYIYRVPKKNVSAFLRIQKEAAVLYRKYGAIDDETFGASDLDAKYGCIGFPDVFDLRKDEEILFSITRFRDRSHQDKVMAKVNADRRINALYDEVSQLVKINRVVRGEFKLATQLS